MIQQIEFWDREREMKFLEERYKSGKSELVIIYGRRRIGKTKILEKFVEKFGGIYFLAAKTSIRENIQRFAKIVSIYTGKKYIESLKTLEDIFTALLEVSEKDERIVVIIDEFPYLVDLNPQIISELQRLWDTILIKDGRVFLILCGSSISVMENEVLSYRSPLYGRRTGSWKVEGFSIEDFIRLFQNSKPDKVIKIWSIWGNVPDYIKEYNMNRSLEWNIKNKILKKGCYLYSEPEILLRQEFREPRNLFLIMRSIAEGNHTPGKIQSASGIDKGNISKYLNMLMRIELIAYEKLYGKKKRGLYVIKDNFFNFWFKCVYPYISELEIGNVDEVYKRIDFNRYFGYMFERFVNEIFRSKGYITYKYLHKGEEIDIIAESKAKNELVICEVKWGTANYTDIAKLLGKIDRLSIPSNVQKKVLMVCNNYRGKEIENVNIVKLKDIFSFSHIQ